jgi:hypothetical protein
MSFQYEIDPARKLARVRPVKIPNIASSLDAIRAIASDPAFGSDFGVLFDFRHIHFAPSMPEILIFGRFLVAPGQTNNHKLALVLDPSFHAEQVRLLENVAQTWGGNILVFSDVEEAERWLTG